ncbi:hypothetical protein D3C86_2146920 [compost metagenome]
MGLGASVGASWAWAALAIARQAAPAVRNRFMSNFPSGCWGKKWQGGEGPSSYALVMVACQSAAARASSTPLP